MEQLPDVQALAPETKFKLTRVGITGVRKLVRVRRARRKDDIVLTATFDVAVDLPPTMKGSHMSRNVESISDILEKNTLSPVTGLEDVCLDIAKDLLRRHDYASEAQVKASADYFLERRTPFGSNSTEWYTLLAEALAKRGDGSRKLIGVTATGTSACPCAMETAKTLRSVTDAGPGLTHNQRNVVTLLVEVPEREKVEADALVDVVESAFSAPTIELLKRRNEGELVLLAHEHPKFVEDVVRGVLSGVVERFRKLPSETVIFARSVAEESIHKHNAYAERETTIAELRKDRARTKPAST